MLDYVRASTGDIVVMDHVDYRRLAGRLISIGSHGYPQIWEQQTVMLLHRWVLGLAVGDPRIADHINGEILDNRRRNLRVVDGTASNLNRSVKGRCVSETPSGRWEARLQHRGRRHHLGTFDTEERAREAVEAFRRAHGIVHLRFPMATARTD